MVVVACWTARIASVSGTTMTSTGRRTSSAARSARRSDLPEAQRYSTVMFWPSIQPRVRNACRKKEDCFQSGDAGGETMDNTPTLGTFLICWAAVATGTAKKPKVRARMSPVVQCCMVLSSTMPSRITSLKDVRHQYRGVGGVWQLVCPCVHTCYRDTVTCMPCAYGQGLPGERFPCFPGGGHA